jgi:hypothetical protein
MNYFVAALFIYAHIDHVRASYNDGVAQPYGGALVQFGGQPY